MFPASVSNEDIYHSAIDVQRVGWSRFTALRASYHLGCHQGQYACCCCCCIRKRVVKRRLHAGLEAWVRCQRHIHDGTRVGRHVPRHLRRVIAGSVCRNETGERVHVPALPSQRIVCQLQRRLHLVRRRRRPAGQVHSRNTRHVVCCRYLKNAAQHDASDLSNVHAVPLVFFLRPHIPSVQSIHFLSFPKFIIFGLLSSR